MQLTYTLKQHNTTQMQDPKVIQYKGKAYFCTIWQLHCNCHCATSNKEFSTQCHWIHRSQRLCKHMQKSSTELCGLSQRVNYRVSDISNSVNLSSICILESIEGNVKWEGGDFNLFFLLKIYNKMKTRLYVDNSTTPIAGSWLHVSSLSN